MLSTMTGHALFLIQIRAVVAAMTAHPATKVVGLYLLAGLWIVGQTALPIR